MDILSLYYFSELSKDLNMTKTAARLFMSQQTLSNHIHRLEQHYQQPLFHRRPTLSLTSAGEQVLSFAKILQKEEANLKDILAEIQDGNRGTLHIGGSVVRGAQLLPIVMKTFSLCYPHVSVEFQDGLGAKMEQLLINGELDFAIILSNQTRPDLIEHRLLDDQIFLCVPEALLRQYYTDAEIREIKATSKNGARLKDFERLPFAHMNNRLGKKMVQLFTREDFHPFIRFTGTYTNQVLPICTMGVAACYSTHTALLHNASILGNDINIFPLMEHDEPIIQHLCLLRHKDRYLTRYAQTFIEILTELTQSMERIPVARIVED